MRLSLSVFVFLFPLLSYTQQNSVYLQFESEKISLGTVEKGEKVDSSFRFKNISDDNVIIDLVSTCECTQANWPKKPIGPGESGEIPFVFDSSKKDNEEELSIDVFLQNVDERGNPVAIFLTYTYDYP